MAGAQRDDVTAVLVHGGFLGPWIWEDVVRLLAQQRIPAVCPDLPSCQETSALADLHDDAQAVRTVLDGCRDVVLCGHSYAGLVVSEAAAGPHKAVRHLVYLAAAIPDAGDSLASLAQAGLPGSDATAEEPGAEEVDVLPDGRLVLRPDAARAGLFHDCPAERADAAIASLRPQAPVTATQLVTGAAWRDIPSTYVRGAYDRLPHEPVAPAFKEHGAELVTLPTGHCPQWSRPDLVAGVLISAISKIRSDNRSG